MRLPPRATPDPRRRQPVPATSSPPDVLHEGAARDQQGDPAVRVGRRSAAFALSTERSITLLRSGGHALVPIGPATDDQSAVLAYVQAVVATLRELGPGGVGRKLLAAAGVRRLVVYRLAADLVRERAQRVPGVSVRPVSEDDIAAYLAFQPGITERAVLGRLRAGDTCIGAWRGERLVGCRWLADSVVKLGYLGISLPLCSAVAYAYDAFTAHEERGRGVGGMVTAALFDTATARGAGIVINAVVPENLDGRRLARRRSTPIGSLRSIRLGPWLLVDCRVAPGHLGRPVPLGADDS